MRRLPREVSCPCSGDSVPVWSGPANDTPPLFPPSSGGMYLLVLVQRGSTSAPASVLFALGSLLVLASSFRPNFPSILPLHPPSGQASSAHLPITTLTPPTSITNNSRPYRQTYDFPSPDPHDSDGTFATHHLLYPNHEAIPLRPSAPLFFLTSPQRSEKQPGKKGPGDR